MSYLRIPFVVLAVINLLTGLWAGLIRAGWSFPGTPLAVHHGAIMVGGFLTTLIILEKVVPLKRNILLVIPLISGFSLLMVLPGYYHPGLYFLAAGSLGLFLVLAYYLYLYPKDLSTLLMMIGAACLIVGNGMLIMKQFYPSAFPWWMAFLLMTITAERLELSKFLPVSKNNKLFLVGLLGLFLVGVLIPFHETGKYLSGIAMIGVAAWMLKHDVIGIGLKKKGLTRFSAVALLLANAWLVVEGVLLIALPETALAYDMMVHVFFIGYAFGMIFAHGPIILPGVLGLTVRPYHPILYAWLLLVQGSLLYRVAFDAFSNPEGRRLSGIITGVGILLYFVTMVIAMRLKSVSTSRP